ncbi:MAG: hypothetical protein K2N83_04880 [Eubacterium sp.]|nr:hypothetical protein [Eubacterium sp.]
MMREEIIKYQFDGLTAEIYDWECLTLAVFLKESVKRDIAEKEMIMAYLRASERLYNGLVIDNNPPYHIKVVRFNQICMPFLYVCRHSPKLSIKLRIRFEIKKNISGHKLSELYKKLISGLPELENYADLSLLVEVFNKIDDGCKLRYSKDRNDRVYQEKPTFIKADRILELTKKICNVLIEPIQNI